ncbi:MAG: hypothetical protein JXR88_13990 [Clostridia bacterium]|nr:hypothetical protein [Clostridia bacterium]
MTNLGTALIPLLILYLILVFVMTPRLYYNRMYSDYMRLLINKPKELESNLQLFTSEWIDLLKRDGFELAQEDLKHLLLCKYYKKLPGMSHSDETLVFIVVAKNKSFDFYGDEVDQGMQSFYMNNKMFEHVSKRITLQFKKYDTIDKKAQEEVETAILYQAGKRTLVNLTYIYLDEKNTVYGLYPEDWYPNRYAYFAVNECKRICDIKE